ncbi:MAG: GTPase domain-containing protein [Oscillospiraceae bacterium]|nr:GTPase domain-containing protein [Oscillospiraceae bacterium]
MENSVSEKGNVLVTGNSGVGKSTLINAVIGEKAAYTAWGGDEGVTFNNRLYEGKELPFDLIDTIGFMPSKEKETVRDITKWIKKELKDHSENEGINVIWFCVDGTAGRLFDNSVTSFAKAVSDWKNIPVIVVITKSYSLTDREPNIRMVHDALHRNDKKYPLNVVDIIPVVSEPFFINETSFAPQDGIETLIERTNSILPEGKKAAQKDLDTIVQKKKRLKVQGIIGGYVSAAVVIAAVPIPFPDSFLLIPLETRMVHQLAKQYGLEKEKHFDNAVKLILEAGAVSVVAKQAISVLKAVPGINLGAVVVNAIVAGAIVAAMGELCVTAFELVSKKDRDFMDLGWLHETIDNVFDESFVNKVTSIAGRFKNKKADPTNNDISQVITDEFTQE